MGKGSPLRRRGKLVVGAVALLAALSGCGGGGPLDEKALGQSADTVHSVAAEGALLAEDAASGSTLPTFRSAHSAALEETVAKEATTLRSAEAGGTLGQRAAEVARLADEVAGLLERLASADGETAAGLARRLDEAATRAGELAGA